MFAVANNNARGLEEAPVAFGREGGRMEACKMSPDGQIAVWPFLDYLEPNYHSVDQMSAQVDQVQVSPERRGPPNPSWRLLQPVDPLGRWSGRPESIFNFRFPTSALFIFVHCALTKFHCVSEHRFSPL